MNYDNNKVPKKQGLILYLKSTFSGVLIGRLLSSFYPLASLEVRISPVNFLNFSFGTFATLS